ncbi:MAG: gliding motility lipoprotein GldH [Bacteroidetes bacterium]|nr:gliding motility lipoprotein GldH [Bacteroidota bacterium]MBU1720194.1 gliding motility lipoprotein GldH [Bacteroidota bacterium]
MRKFVPIAVLLSLAIVSCDPSKVFEQNIRIPESGWNKDSLIQIEALISDTVSPHNVYINVRNTGEYGYQFLYLFLTTVMPEGKFSVDTLACRLANEDGKWLGSGIGDIYDNQILLMKNVRFNSSGKYIFEFQQGMRHDVLKDIIDVGIRIEKSEK